MGSIKANRRGPGSKPVVGCRLFHVYRNHAGLSHGNIQSDVRGPHERGQPNLRDDQEHSMRSEGLELVQKRGGWS